MYSLMCMKTAQYLKKIAALLIMVFSLCGCASEGIQSSSAPSGFPISGHSSIQLANDFKFMPSFSGYYLPPGIYKAEGEDADGVFFKAPNGSKSLSLTGSVAVEGGIYLPKLSGKGVRGYAYLKMPLLGRTPYFLPDDFFSGYGKNWGIIKE